MPNRLANETSPYLLQHADNPVEWYPWGEEALSLAQAEDKPILLSIGYAACHWCHVMAHESFEDQQTAAYMNEHFVNIKVDREERPDLDSIYMSAVVAMTGQGGWPMTVALTPQGEPFFGGTYYPLVPRYGMPSFRQILVSLVQAWQERREDLLENASQLVEHIGRGRVPVGGSSGLDEVMYVQAMAAIAASFDARRGGFGQAPKFPQAMTLEFLLRRYSETKEPQTLHMIEHSLEMMARGGIYDQLGGGFARYSTDDAWLVPHFEKMLYDNALLSRVYLHAWRVTGRSFFRRIAEETLDWVLKEMRDDSGGFYSSLDADSEGEEGRFYVWRTEEIRDALGEDAGLFMRFYDVTEGGNWEGKNILNTRRSLAETGGVVGRDEQEVEERIGRAREKLYQIRSQRVWPGLDDKVLTSWNGLMLAAFAEAGRDLARPDYMEAASANAEFIRSHLRSEGGRLLRTWKAGSEGKFNAYLEDYAYLADGLLALYQSTFETKWFAWAHELADMMLEHFYDEGNGGFFDTSDDHERLIHRPKELQDNATPSGNAMAAHVLLRLSLYTGNGRYWDVAQKSVEAMRPTMAQHPTAFAHWLCAASFIMSRPLEVAIAGDSKDPGARKLIEAIFAQYRPNLVVAAGEDGGAIPLLADRPRRNGQATAYVCRGFVCEKPVIDERALLEQLE